LPQGTRSPVGSQQNKLPPVKGKKKWATISMIS
jgi:hypothetical protein